LWTIIATPTTNNSHNSNSSAWVVVHAPIAFGGLGFLNLYSESNIMKIEAIICHINKMTPLGETMKTILNWVQIHSGQEVPILESKRDVQYIQDNWYTEVKKFLNRCNATIEIKSAWRPRKLQENDVIIMDHPELINITKQNKICLNNWRLFFQVNSIAEMTNYFGDCIMEEFINKKNY
jgi:hypothetical protein